jgi:hypothetical protein
VLEAVLALRAVVVDVLVALLAVRNRLGHGVSFDVIDISAGSVVGDGGSDAAMRHTMNDGAVA